MHPRAMTTACTCSGEDLGMETGRWPRAGRLQPCWLRLGRWARWDLHRGGQRGRKGTAARTRSSAGTKRGHGVSA